MTDESTRAARHIGRSVSLFAEVSAFGDVFECSVHSERVIIRQRAGEVGRDRLAARSIEHSIEC